jgi:glycosyltransferase involved in cell wall biosynthesis
MNSNATITVGLPIYNEEKTLRGTLDSILNQLNENNTKNVKIVISDNCSIDSTPEICKEYLKKYPNLRLAPVR